MAKKREPDFDFVPLSLVIQAAHIMLLDFTCRLLESPLGVEGEFQAIWEQLPTQGKLESEDSDLGRLNHVTKFLASSLRRELIRACGEQPNL